MLQQRPRQQRQQQRQQRTRPATARSSGAQEQIQNPVTNIHSAVQQLKRMISGGQVTSETKRKALAVYKELRNVEKFLRTILTPTDVMMELRKQAQYLENRLRTRAEWPQYYHPGDTEDLKQLQQQAVKLFHNVTDLEKRISSHPPGSQFYRHKQYIDRVRQKIRQKCEQQRQRARTQRQKFAQDLSTIASEPGPGGVLNQQPPIGWENSLNELDTEFPEI